MLKSKGIRYTIALFITFFSFIAVKANEDRFTIGNLQNKSIQDEESTAQVKSSGRYHVVLYGESAVETVANVDATSISMTSAPIVPQASGVSYRRWHSPASITDPGHCPLVTGFGWSNSFGWPTENHVITKGREFGSAHGGIDIALPEGSPIYAAESGRVIWSGYSSFGGGIMVILAHGNEWRTYYAHLSATMVSCGQAVNRGDLVGLSGQTGTSTPHLHFEVQQGNQKHNPLNWLP